MSNKLSLEIYLFLKTIPKNKVVSYKTIADMFHIHPRTVGSIMRRNIYPKIYPCYKVLAANGWVWWYNGGLTEKIKKLQADGIQIVDGKVDKRYFRKE